MPGIGASEGVERATRRAADRPFACLAVGRRGVAGSQRRGGSARRGRHVGAAGPAATGSPEPVDAPAVGGDRRLKGDGPELGPIDRAHRADLADPPIEAADRAGELNLEAVTAAEDVSGAAAEPAAPADRATDTGRTGASGECW